MSWDPDDNPVADGSTVATTLDRPTPYGDLGMFHASLADFCAAEVPLAPALATLDEDLENGTLRQECAALAREIDNGTPFAEAYGKRSDAFPPAYRALVEAGVASGDVSGVLREISVDASLRARIRDRLRRQLEYPLLVAGVVFLLATAVVAFVPQAIPTAMREIVFREIFWIGLGDGAPSPALRGPKPHLVAFALVGLAAVIGLVFAALRKPLDPGAGPRGLRYRLPFFGRLRGLAAKASFASTMALLVRRQVPLPRALALCAAGIADRELRAQVDRMAERANAGDSLSESVRAGDLIPQHLLWFVTSATSCDGSSRALDDIASVYRQRLQRAADRVAAFAVPIVELLIGFVIVAFALDYIQPAFQLVEGVLP